MALKLNLFETWIFQMSKIFDETLFCFPKDIKLLICRVFPRSKFCVNVFIDIINGHEKFLTVEHMQTIDLFVDLLFDYHEYFYFLKLEIEIFYRDYCQDFELESVSNLAHILRRAKRQKQSKPSKIQINAKRWTNFKVQLINIFEACCNDVYETKLHKKDFDVKIAQFLLK